MIADCLPLSILNFLTGLLKISFGYHNIIRHQSWCQIYPQCIKIKPHQINDKPSDLEKLARLNTVQTLAGAGQNQIDRPESVSHEIQDKVSVRTEIPVGAESLIIVLTQ